MADVEQPRLELPLEDTRRYYEELLTDPTKPKEDEGGDRDEKRGSVVVDFYI